MNVEAYFTEMYSKIWQGNDLSQFDEYYAKTFEEIISVCDENNNPVEIKMQYDELLNQAIWQKENYVGTTLEIRKISEGLEDHMSVYFYSSSAELISGNFSYRKLLVCARGGYKL